jgi:hypothetical protein
MTTSTASTGISTGIKVILGLLYAAGIGIYLFFIVRPPDGYIVGTVLNSLTKEPLAGETVFVEDGAGPGVRIGVDGTFFLRTPPGERTLTVSGEDYEVQTLSLSVESKKFTTWTISLVPNYGIVDGEIKNAVTAQFITDQNVSVQVADTGLSISNTGRFRLKKIPPGNATFRLSSSGYFPLVKSVRIGKAEIKKEIFALSPELTNGETLRIVLVWGERPRDLDSHLFNTQTKEHVFYKRKRNKSLPPNAWLDVDDTDSFGPETLTLTRTAGAQYNYYVYNYSGESDFKTSEAEVNVYARNGQVKRFQIPAAGVGRWWQVFTYDSSSGRVSEINKIHDNVKMEKGEK